MPPESFASRLAMLEADVRRHLLRERARSSLETRQTHCHKHDPAIASDPFVPFFPTAFIRLPTEHATRIPHAEFVYWSRIAPRGY